MYRPASLLFIAIGASFASAGCSKTATNGGNAGAGAWIANGAQACERYHSHDVVAAILTDPSGASKTGLSVRLV